MRLITQERERGQNLAKTVVEGKSFDSELLHPLQLLFIEVLKFIPEKKYFKKSDFWTFVLTWREVHLHQGPCNGTSIRSQLGVACPGKRFLNGDTKKGKYEDSTSSLRRNQTNSVYDILPSFCALPRVTAPQKIRSIMRVLKAETKKIIIWFLQSWIPTVVVVPGEILPVDEQVVILVELPELAVDDVEVLVAEEVGHLKEFHESSSLRIEGIHSRNGIFGWKRKLYRFSGLDLDN